MSRILVTGGSGFLANHCVAQALAAGHEVRTTIRDAGREGELRALFGDTPRLSFATADLTRDDGWNAAAQGCDYVLHVASPFPAKSPRNADDLIVPAREGTLRVLRAAKAAGAKRVVLTSSFAAIGYGHGERTAPFTEQDWTQLGGADAPAYIQSKTLAERAAWEFSAREGLELSVVNPTGIFGPPLGAHYAASVRIVQAMLAGQMPLAPRVYFGIVDVRDVAALHLTAMTHPAAAGERFLAVAGEPMSLIDVARVLRERLGAAARKAPRFEIPDVLVRALALFSPLAADAVPRLGVKRLASAAKARERLGWTPRSAEEAITAAGARLVELG